MKCSSSKLQNPRDTSAKVIPYSFRSMVQNQEALMATHDSE